MTSFFTSLHLLNMKQYDFPHSADVHCVKLSEKYNCSHGQYASARNEYFESACSKCEHQWKVKKNIKNVDKLLKNYKCLFLSWDFNHPLILFFSNGSVVSIEFNDKNNTLLKVEIDNNLCGKFYQSRIVDVVICNNCIYMTYTEPRLTVIHINQDSPSLLSKIFGRKKGKLVGTEPKIVNIDLFVHNSKNLERKLSLNTQRNLLLIWWKNSDNVWPWTPATYLIERVNMLIYSLNGSLIELLCSLKAQDELLHATFSKLHYNQFFALEETRKEREIVVNVCIQEVMQGQCQLIYTEKLPVRGSIIAFDWSSDDKLLAADSSGQLLIYDTRKKWNIVTNLELLPKHLSWHPQNCIALIVCRNNTLMCFDSALNSIGFKLWSTTASDFKYLELQSYLHHLFFIQRVLWQRSAFNNTCLLFLDSELASFIFIKFSFGCITRHNVSVLEIVSQHLKSNNVEQAILLLRSLDWCYNSEVKFQCLSKIAQYLLRKPLNFYTLAWLELTIGSFYKWIDITPKRIIEMYEPRMHHIARRFFHHLLRYHKFRKAYLLAIDLESQDLFLDLYYVAEQCNESALAEAAFHKALELNDPSTSSESCSSDTNSESSSDNNDAAYNGNKIPQNMMSQSSHLKGLDYSHSLRKTADTSLQVPEKCTEQCRIKSIPGTSSAFPYSIEQFSVCKRETYISDHMLNRQSEITNGLCSFEFENTKENSTIEEENEEVGGTKIKLAHLGII